MSTALRKARSWARRVRDRIAPKALVLMYHRIAESDSDPWGLCVSPQHFAEQLDVLSSHGPVLNLTQLATAVQSGRVPRNAVAVTFDDGYIDNLEQAAPLLERYGIPATIFVATGYIGSSREYWWDDIERLLLQPGTLPDRLDLDLGEFKRSWELGEARTLTPEQVASSRAWRIPEPYPTPRHAFFHDIWGCLYRSPQESRTTALRNLAAWAGTTKQARPGVRPMTAEELGRLDAGGVVELGAHSVTHPSLPICTPETQRLEIFQSRDRLAEITGHRIGSFAYPHGDFDSQTAGLVREAGFLGACSTRRDLVTNRSDPFRLPRAGVLDWNGEIFARHLAELRRGKPARH
ncbi:polysaccharide deacetylase family protein [Thiocapsa rosea]|uniref:Polysaccharide deacetylase n=1 Tax=Thiocapsa rosea TaxID=69360 RepID=A0A495VDC1_9GAMM|nr:polysaccharide deacetylase family protein [Thiocapsa rosea]RKT47401.1 polysaccharide deacetylase [Thiocapsa rosea]